MFCLGTMAQLIKKQTFLATKTLQGHEAHGGNGQWKVFLGFSYINGAKKIYFSEEDL